MAEVESHCLKPKGRTAGAEWLMCGLNKIKKKWLKDGTN